MAGTGDLAKRLEDAVRRAGSAHRALDRMDWGRGVDPKILWLPEPLAPLWGMPSYELLSPAHRLAYNQYVALQTVEQLAWTERHLIVAPVRGLLRRAALPTHLRPLLTEFVQNEERHTAALGRLLVAARPDLYDSTTMALFRPSRRQTLLAGLYRRLPYHLTHWTTVVAALESRAIAVGGAFLEARAQIDPLFTQLFIRHAYEELRHREIDDLIAGWLLSGRRRWAAWIDAKACELSFAASFHEDASASLAVIRLVADFPALKPHELLLIEQATAGQGGAFVDHLLDTDQVPFTQLAADRRAVLRQAIRHHSGGALQ